MGTIVRGEKKRGFTFTILLYCVTSFVYLYNRLLDYLGTCAYFYPLKKNLLLEGSLLSSIPLLTFSPSFSFSLFFFSSFFPQTPDIQALLLKHKKASVIEGFVWSNSTSSMYMYSNDCYYLQETCLMDE